MSAAVGLAAAGVVSWVLRVLFIAVVPVRRLPDRLRATLNHAGTAVLAALVAGGLARPPGGGVPVGAVLALLVGALAAWRTRSLLVSVAAAVGTFALLGP
ncbi:AzlD domain-containing protein [Pseudonocardia sp.]|uniref:AzlD domain-containing protein n=1 Tax=Pseudonocardia sp. TaxID=60912 RepID=UPI003D0B6E3E